MVAIAPSTWRPPWLDTTSPSIPCSIAASASAGWRIPLSRIGSRVRSRRKARSSHESDGREYVSTKRRTAARASPDRTFARREPGIRAGLSKERSDRGERDAAAWRRLLSQRLLQRLDEDRIARVLRDPLAPEERQIGEVEIADPPAEHRRVEREHDRRAPAALRTRDEALDQLVRRAPVELEPARGVAHRPRGLLHGSRGLVREDERDALGRSRAGDGDVGIAVCHLEHADRAENERARHRRSEHLGGGVPASRRRGASAGRSASARTRRGSRASSPRCRRRPRRRRSPPATWPCVLRARADRPRRAPSGSCHARR